MAQGYGYRSEQRLRKENQDTFGVFEFADFTLLVVCDGMGGHVGGRQASSIAVRTIHDELKDYTGGDVRGALRRAIEAANRAIYEMARKNYRLMGMGTTCVAAAVVGSTAHVAHVGDSRAYLVRDGQIRALTRDHTMVNLFVDAELLSPEDAATHPEAHVLSRSLGVERQVEVDLAEPLQIQSSDRILLCSDGIHGVVGASGLGSVDWRNPQEGVDATLTAVERAQGDDNATLVAFGASISGASSPTTTPPDLASLEEEARQAPVQAALQPVRRPTLVPNAGTEELPIALEAEPTADDDAPTSDLVPRVPRKKGAKPAKAASSGKGVDRRVFVAVAAVGLVGLIVLGAVFAPTGGTDAPSTTPQPPASTAMIEPLPEVVPASPVAQPASPTGANPNGVGAAIAPPAVVDDAPSASTGTRGMLSLRCIDCTGSFALPSAAAYLSAAHDPEVAVAFFAPEIPPAPRRLPNTTAAYDHPPPSGPEQTKAVRAARNKRCREALDTVREAIAKSIDYASLYGAAWYCFNDTHTNVLGHARAATWDDFKPLLEHFEGNRRIPVGAFPPTPPPDDDATADADPDANPDAAPSTPAPLPDMPDIWQIPAAGGVEYRLALFEIDGDMQGFRDIIVDLLGEAQVADHLAADVLIEATAAASVARMDDPTPEALQVWARRVYVASRAMTGPVGELIRAHRPEVAGMIEALLFEATGGDEGLLAIKEGYPNEAVPPVVARAQDAGLAGMMPDLFGESGTLSQLPDAAPVDLSAPPEANPEWRRPTSVASRRGSTRGSYARSRSSAAEDVRNIGDPSQFDWESFGYLKVWYPRQRLPRVLVPYGANGEPLPEEGSRVEGVEVYKRNSEKLDPDWEKAPEQVARPGGVLE
ncbi:MAG: protein phosphatase 2C domain-containing protein [Alphaproteobacteria bacterium]|nr:protein phosphatase 2C domain-containing protein [Alphaproteobacteria bacterium]